VVVVARVPQQCDSICGWCRCLRNWFVRGWPCSILRTWPCSILRRADTSPTNHFSDWAENRIEGDPFVARDNCRECVGGMSRLDSGRRCCIAAKHDADIDVGVCCCFGGNGRARWHCCLNGNQLHALLLSAGCDDRCWFRY